MKRTVGRIAGLTLLVVVLLIVGVSLWFWKAPLPRVRGRVRLAGINSEVAIVRDRYGVPHITAQSAEDLFFAQGYVHAQDRFWQMEMNRRTGSGELAELFGAKLKDTDVYLRTMGFRRTAVREYETLDAATRRDVDAYAAGVNACISTRKPHRLALEFALLRLQGVKAKIRPWTGADTVVWAKMMNESLAGYKVIERLQLALIRSAGLRVAADFFSPIRPEMPIVVARSELPAELQALPAPKDRIAATGGEPGSLGSNACVLSGRLTDTGKPILGNDVHLPIAMPSLWYEVHLVCRAPAEADRFAVRGFSLPGVPGVVIGHNERISWGMSVCAGDVQDLYVERVNPQNPDQYEHNGRWIDMDVRYETIKIRKEPEPYVLRVRSTRHGPIISDQGSYSVLEGYELPADRIPPEGMVLTAVALRWPGLEPGGAVAAVLRLNRARNYEQFRQALSLWDGPTQGFSYADADGNIAFQVVAHYPIRPGREGRTPVPGWVDSFDWSGIVPFDHLPRTYNPAKGYIVSANNQVAGPDYSYRIDPEADYGYRARRIVGLVEGNGSGISVDDIKAMHADVLDTWALEILPYLGPVSLEPDAKETALRDEERKELSESKLRKAAEADAKELAAMEKARERLLGWDGRMSEESGDAALFACFLQKLIEEVYRDQYPESRWPATDRSRMKNNLWYMLQDETNAWWDDNRTPEVRERRDDILGRAFRKGYQLAAKRLGKDPKRWKWSRIHKATFRSTTLGSSGIKPIESIFNRSVPVGGGLSELSVTAWSPGKPFDVIHIAMVRQIIDWADLDRSLFLHVPGQSGHPASRHYSDFMTPWRRHTYHPGGWSEASLKRIARSTLTLAPAKEK